MDKYRLIGSKKGEGGDFMGDDSGGAGDLKEGDVAEVKIIQQGKPRNYISYAINLFEQGSSKIVLKAMGRAINKAVTIAEILKRKMPLHQVTTLSSSVLIDVYEPLEEGLDIVESKRPVSCMTITLSKDGAGMDLNDIGYQPPLPLEEIQPGDLNPRSDDLNVLTIETKS
uniref:DNA/RNA-binding protein Alba-like domain-containing protein n=1 Tax=Eucampia antarctica TaxID=49252 RepID=A0A7S2R0H5_9STRA|mmetsp:Transcript_11276/g.10785  ORF Transcript_11276/g.10785 Transcript_11276/m.10785 type:complete len:170 (+) Transcript_11276:76-585(+)|eukprot:CAMPEP_0197827424 /NCGR_PEP_ID=MMETSP1437-20131217/4201_1 /TAXON_ID=49252 ORGANISM="Eucampia antarctica, Strain CCMP1452" /NCGR_SAMPLE_ID=MMETSP1437 /ASSEMBLY_ACC=CAM_ASM_001096 /LENGTH=169 /DNA_ID=CAMNT_0043428253 /DNA_START=75 /DNA_END=584 /DNA_ORIENTATION=+